ncbi:hypothetical protein [Streptomyces ardesiacus]|uniref:hypothetical protein n=1 Tax=Streptomyces ardesiacus TaxID=285564 RepID=UPI002FDBC182
MIEPSSSLPGDPSELHLRLSYDDELRDTSQADTLERWNVAVLHRRRIHHGGQDPAPSSDCVAGDCPSCTVEDAAVGSMTFYRVHLDRGRNAYWAMEEESSYTTPPRSSSIPRRAPSPRKPANDWSTSAQRCSLWIE